MESIKRLDNRGICLAFTVVLLSLGLHVEAGSAAQTAPPVRTPTETVREFYTQLRARHFRQAFALSIFKPAIDAMSEVDFEDFKPDFERMASNIPERIDFNGEQISGDKATVFMKVADVEESQQPDPVQLVKKDGIWIVGAKDDQEKVKKTGKDFFLNARIDTHEQEAKIMLGRITAAEFVYSSSHAGKYADMQTLITAGLLPKDIEATYSTGYNFHISVLSGGKGYKAGAEPARYSRTGRLSFFLDPTGMKFSDVGGRPFPESATKK